MGGILMSKERTAMASDSNDAIHEYLTFMVDGQDYGIDLLSVTEIRGWTAERPLPNSPSHVRGVINLRGLVIPIYDLRIRLGAPAVPPTVSNVVIVVQAARSEEHTSELQSLMRISYAVFCLKK